jgi:diguanylate cyclase (GGDEF)-like protein/PAS domain S-box-containing protein
MGQPLLKSMFFDDDVVARDAAVLTQKTLVDTQERMGMILDVMPMGLLIHTEQAIIFANQEACRSLQVDQHGIVGQHFLDFVAPGEIEPVSRQFQDSFRNKAEMHNQETKITRADGSELNIKLISCRLPWQGNPVIQVLLQDVTDMKQTEQKLRRLTITDELTGAFNRRHAFYEAALYIDPERKPPIPLAAILLDVDHFKKINDTFGHAAGDIALRQLAAIGNDIIENVCHADSAMLSRIGGEEFLVLLPGAELQKAQKVAERLRRAIEGTTIDTPQGSFRMTVSMGVACFERRDRTFDGLLSRSDAALYEAKKAGRNRVVAG